MVDPVDSVAPVEPGEPVDAGADEAGARVAGDPAVSTSTSTPTSTDGGLAAPEVPAGTAQVPTSADPTVPAAEVFDEPEPAAERLHPLLVTAVLLVTGAVVAVLLLAAGHVVKL